MADVLLGRTRQRRAARVFRDRRDWLEILNEKEVRAKYRLSKERIKWLHELIKTEIQPTTSRSHPISSMTKLLITLQFLAKGEFYGEGGLIHGVSKSSVCRCIWQVLAAIDRKLKNIKFPTSPEELAANKQKFYRLAHVPNCIGAIDCTLIPIIAPTEREDIYVCRKGYHAINVQAVVDTNMKFTNVVARWPGSTHDNVIFENSGLKQWMESGNHGWLIGDSGYALKNYMLTPKVPSQDRGCLQFAPEKCAQVFLVCAKLHNLCIDDGMTVDDIENDYENNNDIVMNQEPNAMRAREAIINTF